jgi:hypothetical protein
LPQINPLQQSYSLAQLWPEPRQGVTVAVQSPAAQDKPAQQSRSAAHPSPVSPQKLAQLSEDHPLVMQKAPLQHGLEVLQGSPSQVVSYVQDPAMHASGLQQSASVVHLAPLRPQAAEHVVGPIPTELTQKGSSAQQSEVLEQAWLLQLSNVVHVPPAQLWAQQSALDPHLSLMAPHVLRHVR